MNVARRMWFAPLSAAVVFLSAHARIARADPLTPSPAAHYPPGTHYRPLCPGPDERGRRCFGQILVDANDKPISDTTSPPGGWTPTELEAAYGLPSTGGKGTVIATYIGSHYTNAEADVAAYRSKFGMAPCTSASGCFTQVTDKGGTDFSGLTDDGCNGMVGEESLDIDMLMAGCPNCKILVIEGNDNTAAQATAQSFHAVTISMSWGYTPESESDCQSNWVPPKGLALFAASGDQGYAATPGEPGSCTDVIAVGWTQLATASTARGYADTLPAGWGSAGGCDTAMTKASWQTDPGCSSRMISDLSANGDNVAAYCTSPAGSADWHVTGGSSASSPFTTGVLATLGVTGGSFDAAWIYENADKFWDVTSGGPVQSCPSGAPKYFCNAVPGIDGPTGVGTPYGPGFVGLLDAGSSIDAGSGPPPGADAGSGSDGGGSSSHDASVGLDATAHDAGGSSGGDGATSGGNPGTGAGAGATSSSAGCNTAAGSVESNAPAALGAGMLVAWRWRRRRRAAR
jgi:MYXO-CTERM domain-containing protein